MANTNPNKKWKSRVFLKLNLIVGTYLLSCSSMKLGKWKLWLNMYKKLKNHLYLHAQNMFSYFSQENFRWIHRKKFLSFLSYVLMKSVFTVRLLFIREKYLTVKLFFHLMFDWGSLNFEAFSALETRLKF
jgi:hypothetical protein